MFARSRLRSAAARHFLLPWLAVVAASPACALVGDAGTPGDEPPVRPAALSPEAEARAEALARVATAQLLADTDPELALGHNLRALDLDPSNAPLAREIAAVMLQRGDIPEALGVLKDSLKRNPQSAQLLLRIAAIYIAHLRKAEPAERYARQALAAAPDLIECYQMLYSIQRAAGRPAAAAKLLVEAGARTNDDARFWAGLGDLWMRQLLMEGRLATAGREAPALSHYRRAAQLARQDPDVLQRVLNFFFACGQFEDAVQAARRLLVLQPDDTLSREKLAGALAALGRDDEAVAELETVVAENPASLVAYRTHGAILIKRGDFAGALTKFEKALALHDEDPRLFLELVDLCLKAGNAERGAWWLARARERFSRLPDLPFHEARLLAQLKRWREALDACDVAADLAALHQPAFLEDPEFHFIRGMAAERVGEREAAVRHFRECLARDPEHSAALNYLGYMWAESGENLAEAEGLIRRALEIEPANAAYLDSLGWVLFQQGRYHEALAPLERAAELSGRSDPTIVEHLGDTLAKLGRTTEAVKAWERAASLEGASPELPAKLRSARQALGLASAGASANKP
jgi:tetratricopeptide (TPR) repeat protein